MARDKAELMLTALRRAERAAERPENQTAAGPVLPSDQLSATIRLTQRLIAELNRALRDAEAELSREDLAALDGVVDLLAEETEEEARIDEMIASGEIDELPLIRSPRNVPATQREGEGQ